jgi:hypothetical protein
VKGRNGYLWLCRLLILVVFFFNVYCAYQFLTCPGRYAPAYELFGEVGANAVRGFGLLFLMWNVPYFVALLNPFQHFVSLLEALSMQLIGVVGEGFIWLKIDQHHLILKISIERFLVFDLIGLVLLLAAAWISFRKKVVGNQDSPGKEKSTAL